MNYTQEDLMKIKQLVATTDMDNVRVGIQIAKGLGVSIDELVGLFTMDDVKVSIINKYGHIMYSFIAFGDSYKSYTNKTLACKQYKDYVIPIVKWLLNED